MLVVAISVGVIAFLISVVLAGGAFRDWLNIDLPKSFRRFFLGSPRQRLGNTLGGDVDGADRPRVRPRPRTQTTTPKHRYVVALVLLACLTGGFTAGALLLLAGTSDAARLVVSGGLFGLDAGSFGTMLAISAHWAGVL